MIKIVGRKSVPEDMRELFRRCFVIGRSDSYIKNLPKFDNVSLIRSLRRPHYFGYKGEDPDGRIKQIIKDLAAERTRRKTVRLSPYEINDIKQRSNAGETYKSIAEHYGVSSTRIGYICGRKKRQFMTQDIGDAMQVLRDEGWKMTDVAEHFGKSLGAVANWTKSKKTIKLTQTDKDEIRARRDAGEMVKDIAIRFGVSDARISNVIHRRGKNNQT